MVDGNPLGVFDRDGKPLREGDEIVDFRGNKARYCGVSDSGRKVYVDYGDGIPTTYFVQVFGLIVSDSEV